MSPPLDQRNEYAQLKVCCLAFEGFERKAWEYMGMDDMSM